MNKLLFLDIDGVLNSDNTLSVSPSGFPFVSNRLVKRLSKIIKATEANVVLTSTWRINHDEDYWALIKYLDKYGIHNVDETPVLLRGGRADEIKQYLDVHPSNLWCVVDDLPLKIDNFVHTEFSIGLTKENANKIIEILNK